MTAKHDTVDHRGASTKRPRPQERKGRKGRKVEMFLAFFAVFAFLDVRGVRIWPKRYET